MKKQKPVKMSRAETKKIIDAVADELISKLKKVGFTVQRYDSYSSMSIYLKLDYGVCNSIRISDHKGKKHLAYRYNFLTNIPKHIPYHSSLTKEGWQRHFYRPESIDVFMNQLKQDYFKKFDYLGPSGYRQLMERNRLAGQSQKGFWQQAVIV